MEHPNPVSTLHRALVEARVPSQRRSRLLAEYADHREAVAEDLRTEGLEGSGLDQALSERMGDPKALAELARQKIHAETFLGRHPRVGFSLVPLLSVVLLIPAIALCIIAIAILAKIPDPQTGAALKLIVGAAFYVIPVLATAWWFRVASQRALGPGYVWLAGLSGALPAAFFRANVILSDIQGESVFQFLPRYTPSLVLPLTALVCLGLCLRMNTERESELVTS